MGDQVQTSITLGPATTRPGQLHGSGHKIVEVVATGNIPFGVYVPFKVSGEAAVPGAAGDLSGNYEGGIVAINHTEPSGEGYKAGDVVPVCVFGKITPLSEGSLALADVIFVRYATGAGGTQNGALRNSADTATAGSPASPRIKVDTPGAAGLAIVKIGF